VAGVILHNKIRYGYTTPEADRLGVTEPAWSSNGEIRGLQAGEYAPNKILWNRANCNARERDIYRLRYLHAESER
jgi:hypothetical protein